MRWSTKKQSEYSRGKVGCSKDPSYASNPVNPIKQKTNSNSKLSCFYTNATSLNNKINELKIAVSHYNQPHIILITETWFNSNSITNIPNYNFYLKNRSTTRGGGVVIYVREDLSSSEISDPILTNCSEIEQIWCTVKIGHESIIIGCVYRPPQSERSTSSTINKSIQRAKILSERGHTGLLIAGDFNHPSIIWTPLGGSSSSNRFRCANDFLETINSNFITQNQIEPTMSNNILDLVLTESPNRIHNIITAPPLGSTKKEHLHSTLLFSYNLQCNHDTKVIKKIKYIFRKSNFAEINDSMLRLNLEEDSVTDKYTTFLTSYEAAIKKHTPIIDNSSYRKIKPKWFNKELKTLAKKKITTWNKLRATSATFKPLARETYKKVCKDLKAKIKSSIFNYEMSLVAEAKKNPKLIFSYINSQKKIKDSIESLVDSSGKISTNRMEISNILNNQFYKVFSSPNTNDTYPNLPIKAPQCDIDPEALFSSESVKRELEKLNINKTPGGDGVHPLILKVCSDSFSKQLSHIYKASYMAGEIPEQWKCANITPIYKKKGKKTDPSSYRPISLTVIPCKIMEKLVKKAMVQHLEEFGLISNHQHGFVKKKSCVTNLLEALDTISEIVHRGFSIDLIFLDFAKAFDMVSHNGILFKLKFYGFSNKITKFI